MIRDGQALHSGGALIENWAPFRPAGLMQASSGFRTGLLQAVALLTWHKGKRKKRKRKI